MKKIITICLLGLILMVAEIPAEAKTSNKKSARTTQTTSQSGAFTVKCLLHKQNNYGTVGFMFNSDSQIDAALKKAGFTLKSKKVTKGEIADGTEGDTAPGKTIDYVYTKKGITVEWRSYAYDEAPNDTFKDTIEINFSDSAAKNAFIKTVKSNGYKLDYGIYVDAAQMIHIKVKGNKVILYGNWA